MWSHPSSLSSSSTTLYCVLFSCPWAFFKGTPFFTRAVFMSWVGCQLEWLFSRLDRSSGRQRNRGQIGSGRNQLQLATRLFFYSPNLKSCQTSDFLDYIKLYARSKRTQPAPARNSPLFLLSQLKVLSDFLDYIKLDARSNRTQPNLARNSLFSFRGSLLFPK